MRILICTNAYPPVFMGGAELVAHEQAKAFAALGHQVAVFSGGISGQRKRHSRIDEHYEGVAVARIETSEEDYSPAHINFLNPVIEDHFQNLVRSFRPDAVHFHNIIGLSVRLPILAKSAGVKTACTLHDFWGFCIRNTGVRRDGQPCDPTSVCSSCVSRIHDGRGLHLPPRFRRDMVRLSFEHMDHVISPSRYVAARYETSGLAEGRISVVPNGVQPYRFDDIPPPPKSKTTIAFAGYFGKHKGVATLISAVARISKEWDVDLLLAGEGPEETNYKHQIQALGIEDRVRFLGKVPHGEMFTVYTQSDIICLPSTWDENQPVCLMEAMSAARPVVASRKGGIPELIEHGRNGFLFDADDVGDLATQLSLLCADPKRRVRMGCHGKARVENQTYEKQAKLNLEVYNKPPATKRYRQRVIVFGGLKFKPSNRDRIIFSDPNHWDKIFIPFCWLTDGKTRFDYAWLMSPKWLEWMMAGRFFRKLIPLGSNGFSLSQAKLVLKRHKAS